MFTHEVISTLFQKLKNSEKPEVAKFGLELRGVSLFLFFSVYFCFFQTVCLNFSEGNIHHFISSFILHLKWWAVGSSKFLVNGPRLPSLSTLCFLLHLLSKVFFSPLSSGFLSFLLTSYEWVVSFFLPSPQPGWRVSYP